MKSIHAIVAAVAVATLMAACAPDTLFGDEDSWQAKWTGTEYPDSVNGGPLDGYDGGAPGSGGGPPCGSEGGATGSGEGGTPCGSGGGAASGGAPGSSDDCSVTECFDVQGDKDISFIAVLAEPCSGAAVTLELFDDDGDSVDIVPAPHGQGTPCAGVGIGIDPQAMKFEGLSDDHYTLCVTYDGVATSGGIVVTAKAGTMCWDQVLAGSCEPCACDGGGNDRCDHDDDDDDGSDDDDGGASDDDD